MTSSEPIAIIGSACRFPGGADTPSKLWELLKEPRDLLQKVPEKRRWHSEAFYHKDPEHHGTSNVSSSYFLDDDPASFDNTFFNIQPSECEAIDPQQRMLMETVYDSVCSAGQTIDGLRGSSTAVYVGMMCDDWSAILTKDAESIPQYSATGMGRSIMSNRISYFFDWHGPSITLDTACSSSLVAVHLAVQALRNGDCGTAIAAGVNLCLSPGMYIATSNLHMLSEGARSRMWDKDVDGYARGEGIASVVLKPLSAAIRDGDHIECLIRATGVNQDGKTQGLTMPSATAQTALIRQTYERAGLDIEKPEDRPQFFHAHGTGTPAGDPQEAEAISTAFYSGGLSDKLYVGSIKTVIGHTEGTAGLASLIGTSLALQHGVIPPNLLFNELNPRLIPFYNNLEVPTSAKPWPQLLPGQARRASVNSFGFGGTNAHAIVEAYEPPTSSGAADNVFAPLVFSAATEKSLRASLSAHGDYLQANPQVPLRNFAYTLQERRSTLAFRAVIPASNTTDAVERINALLDDADSVELGTKHFATPHPRLLGVFTGQGAQWPRMGAQIVEASPYASKKLGELDTALATLPPDVRPSWTLREEILADLEVSKVAEAAISQPLCTAVQILLVDLLTAAGIRFDAVVGHSSGEIGAAYAAGFISAETAIRVAYLRGFYAKLAGAAEMKGSMMAVGTSYEDALEFCQLEHFMGRISVAAVNSDSSITLSGNEDAIMEAVEIFKDEGKFARQLKVDTAYHSVHMLPCSEPYLKAMESVTQSTAPRDNTAGPRPTWYSSVLDGAVMGPGEVNSEYWVSNMVNPVLFSAAVAAAVSATGPFNLALEVGPHPALKGPCLDTLAAASGDSIPYSGLLSRSKNDILELSSALGFVWANLGASSVRFGDFEKLISGVSENPRPVKDLPKYAFDHTRSFWQISRASGAQFLAQDPPHPILGKRCLERETSQHVEWRNILSPKELPWLQGHRIQGGMVFPAAGYVAMAIEAMKIAVGKSRMSLIHIENLHIGRAMAFNQETSTMECLFRLNIVNSSPDSMKAKFSCCSGAPYETGTTMVLNAEGTVTVTLAEPEPDAIPYMKPKNFNMTEIEVDRFYTQIHKLGYEYSAPFRGMLSIQRKNAYALGTMEDQGGSDWEDQLLVHPGMLDTAIQSSSAAFGCPGDGMMWTLYIPTGIQSIIINPYYTTYATEKQEVLPWETISRGMVNTRTSMDINIFSQDNAHTFIQVEGLELVPFTAARPEDDANIFSSLEYRIDSPSGDLAVINDGWDSHSSEAAIKGERVSFFYLRRLLEEITPEEKEKTLPHYRHLLNWAAHVVARVSAGKNPCVPASCMQDTQEIIDSMWDGVRNRADIRLIESVGRNLIKVVREGSGILEHMDGLFDFYDQGLGLDRANRHLARMVGQLAHRYPHMNIFEIGAGTGGSTRNILSAIREEFSTYTYTDVSSGFFEAAQELFQDYEDRMIYSTYNMEHEPTSQGFEEGHYDLLLASNVLHATDKLEEMMLSARKLLKPGGYLIALELTNNDSMRVGLPMGTLPGWWLGAETGRPWGPTVTLPQWDSLLRKCGFGGIDTSTPIQHRLQASTIFAAQAVDDRVNLLRNPLSLVNNLPLTDAPRLVIIGGESLATHAIANNISSLLASHYSEIVRIVSFADLDLDVLPYGTAVLSLADLDEPVFKDISPAKLDALKTLWRQAFNIVWVTQGARAAEPYSSMMIGLGRAMIHEYPTISLQLMDIDTIADESRATQLIAKEFIRLELLNTFKRGTKSNLDLLWSIESEVTFEGSARLIPRLYLNKEANARYNSARRSIETQVNWKASLVTVALQGDTYGLSKPSPLRLPISQPSDTKVTSLNVSHFLLQGLKIDGLNPLVLCAGTERSTGKHLLALSHSLESQPEIQTKWSAPLPSGSDPSQIIAAVAAEIIADQITKLHTRSGIMIIHEATEQLAVALHTRAQTLGCQIVFTTSSKDHAQRGWQFIPQNISRRLIKRTLPADSNVFIDLSYSSASVAAGRLISGSVSKSCAKYTSDAFYSASVSSEFDLESSTKVEEAFQQAYDSVTQSKTGLVDPITIPIQEIGDVSVSQKPLAVVVSSATNLAVKVEAIDSGVIFRQDKTYLLIGMSGQVGQSLCQWMVKCGARHVVLTSRRPLVHDDFIESMKDLGANVRTFALDITQRESLHKCYEEIVATMPPIAGVANGAMILRDSMFDGMTFQNLTTVLEPKVAGTRYLDELFYDAPLDFFIVLSSITSLVGNSSQSNYTAANMFMVALVEQRRKRGVPGSAISISALIGIGYVENSEFTGEYFENIGLRNISEQDLHQQFAEAILAGRPETQGSSEVAIGLIPFYPERDDKAQFHTDIKFNHLMLERKDAQIHGGKGSALPVRVQLAEAKTKDQAATIIKDGFMVRLKRTLMIGLDEVVNEKVPLVEQGIDSLMAVEIRAWFLKELDVDIPVLKVLGGSNITELLQEAMDRTPSTIIDFSSLSNAKAAAPVTNTATPPPEVQVTGSASDSSRSLTPDGLSTSRPSTPVRTPMTEINDPTPSFSLLSVAPDIAPKVPESVSPMSYGQARFWFLSDYLEDKTSFNMTVMFKLTGRLQVPRLERAVRTIAHRHDALRTRFFWGGEGDKRIAMQGISAESSIELEHVRINSEADAKNELRKMHEFVWDLDSHQAARMVLLTINENEHYFMTSGHHISWDGYGFTVLFIDLDAAYRGEPLSPNGPETQYPAFAAWQRDTYAAGAMKKSIDEYYRPMIDPEARPLPLFPFARAPNRPLLDHFEQFEAKVTLQPHVVSKLKQVSRKNGATMFHLYLAALQALVFRLLPEEQSFYLGVADANRLDKNFMGSLGFFLNLLPVRFDRTAPGTKSSDMIKDTRNKAYKALENSFVPWDVLLHELKIPRTNTEAPIFQLFVDYRQIVRERAQWCGCSMSDEDWLNARNGYDLTLGITDNPTGESLLSLRFQKKLYSEESTEMFLRSYVNVLEALASGKDLLVDDLPRWAGADVEEALNVGRGPQLELEWPVTVSHRIDQMIGTYASKPALQDEHNNCMSYEQMGHRINTIAAALIQAGTTTGTPVGVFQTPSSDWICSMLAIFRVGATYIPLDLRNSVARVSFIVEIAQPLILLTDRETTLHVAEIQASNATEIIIPDLSTTTMPLSMENQARPDSPAVTLFTSGTTGRPKGVVLTHANLRAQCEGYSRMVNLQSMTSVVLQQTNYNFDVSLDQIFAALAEGGCLYVVPASKRGDPQAITKIMAEKGVTYTVATPSEYETWFRYAPETLAECKSWGYAFGGGEHLNNGLIGEFAALSTRHIPELRLFNNYGPTEASLAITKGEVDFKRPDLEKHVPAGMTIPNYAVAIVDENLKPVPLETVGEIVAGGPGVAAGYLGQADLTREKFISGHDVHRLAAQHSDRWYRTGDRGYLRPDGALFVHGRILGDTQVKIRGFRVELQEIENVVLETAKGALTHAVVSLRGTGEDKFLTAHVVFAPDFAMHLRQDLIRHLEAALPLPSYMQPTVIVPLTKVPVTTNFKIDRNAIQAMPLPQAVAGTDNLANMEGRVAALWRIIIPHLTQELTPESDFFAVGGNSILLVKLQAAIKRELQSSPQLIDLINSSSLEGMARHVRAAFINRIDWDLETAVPADLKEDLEVLTSQPRKHGQDDLTVVITGSTGYLGRHVLAHLVDSSNVRQIICLVRPEHLQTASPLSTSSKIRLVAADISQPSLGLGAQTFAELAQITDIVFHCAANRSFWDGFESLRHVNFDAAKELARLCVANDAVLHFMSSGAVSKYNDISPPTDGSDGYIASKWAAEEFLRRVAKFGLRVQVHRPLALPSEKVSSLSQEDLKRVQDELPRLIAQIGQRPEFSAIHGHIDVRPVSDVATTLVEDMLVSSVQESGNEATVKNHAAHLRLQIKTFAEQIDADEELSKLPTMDALQWFGAAKRAGFGWLIGAMEMHIEGDDQSGTTTQVLVQR
uniref:Hybrid PKS-NRPS synthetase phm1 n=1 Tax=Pyrenochaetopsis sp. TaxID=1756125 RepID=PHM1_PYRSX|nr:RecName: Full=Hybrid PKS-NRPS synthetase phm1; Short=PKS-NRPS phm1; AltName: Full=Phomasetin biosynthesis cluster protein 1 [Pyrenochaetopsis sp.]BBC43184.1 PKS-NRPS hybrid [Pyrenochaetopsis sp.]